jgi:tRNA pseudouridine13 synthase
MKLKHRPADFRVRELLREGYLGPGGRHSVYLVEKRKHTTLEAARILADLAGVPPARVGLAGLKDRQGVTAQYMSVPGGRQVELRTPELSIHLAGRAREPLTSAASEGNEFTILVRGVGAGELEELSRRREEVRRFGLVNYFGAQRFGNLEHGQGWIARELARGRTEAALRVLLVQRSPRDDERRARAKAALEAAWGDWAACREIAARISLHRSLFEHLVAHPGDFAGAFRYVASRIRLIHLYAWQSHVWNRAVARLVERETPPAERLVQPGPEGLLVFHRAVPHFASDPQATFRLPGPRLADVADPDQRALLAEVLADQGLRPEEFEVLGVPGFQLKGEERALLLFPQDLATRVEEPRPGGRGEARVRLRFRLPRGAYAMLVVERLLGPQRPAARDGRRERGPARGPAPFRRGGKAHGGAREDEGRARKDRR